MIFRKEPRINLLRYLQEERLEQRKNIRYTLILMGVALLFLVGMGGVWWMQVQQLEAAKATNQQLQQEVDKLTTSVSVTDPGSIDQEQYEVRRTMISTLEKQAKVKSPQFQEIYLLSIPGVTIGKMEARANNSFTMSAYCNSQAKFITFLEQLRQLEFIKEVKNISSKRNAKTGEVNFNLTLVWEEIK